MMRSLSRQGNHVMFGTTLNCEDETDPRRIKHIPLTDGGGLWVELGIFTLRDGIAEPATGNFLAICVPALEAME